MKSFFGKIVSFFHNHPVVKTTVVGVGSLALTAAANGVLGPKAAVVAGAATSVIGLFIKRPQDGSGEAK